MKGLNSLGAEYVESFFRYIDPATGELMESAHVLWEEDMEGEYSHIRSRPHGRGERSSVMPVCS